MNLWPRLPMIRATAIAAGFAGRSLESLQSVDWTASDSRCFAPTGGLPVGNSTLRALRGRLEDAARGAGYPDHNDRAALSRFDASAQRVLLEFTLPYGEAVRADMWAWITVFLVPHLVKWRWTDRNDQFRIERFAGPLVRNCLGRLWYQAVQIASSPSSDDRLLLLEAMAEDQRVSLFERPSLAANRAICVAVAATWTAIPVRARKEALFREAMKGLIVRGALQRFDALESDVLNCVVLETFAATAVRLNLPPLFSALER